MSLLSSNWNYWRGLGYARTECWWSLSRWLSLTPPVSKWPVLAWVTELLATGGNLPSSPPSFAPPLVTAVLVSLLLWNTLHNKMSRLTVWSPNATSLVTDWSSWKDLCLLLLSNRVVRSGQSTKMKALRVIAIVICLAVKAPSKLFSRCELLLTLQRSGMDDYAGYRLADCELLPICATYAHHCLWKRKHLAALKLTGPLHMSIRKGLHSFRLCGS